LALAEVAWNHGRDLVLLDPILEMESSMTASVLWNPILDEPSVSKTVTSERPLLSGEIYAYIFGNTEGIFQNTPVNAELLPGSPLQRQDI
jgi:hypothetical protein